MRMITTAPVFALILLIATAAASAKEPPTTAPSYRCVFTTTAPKIDGNIDDEVWTKAEWTADFVDVTTADKAPHRTRVRMLWDADNLYLAAELEEPHVRGSRTRHDDFLYLENAFEVFLDPDQNGRNYAELEINALNTTLDLVMDKPFTEHGTANVSWTAKGWKTAVHVDGTINDPSDQDKGWTVEMAIPLSALKRYHPSVIPPKNGTRWRAEFARINSSEDDKGHWVWSPIGKVNFHVPEKWGTIEFVK